MALARLAFVSLMIGCCLSSPAAQSTAQPTASPATVSTITGRVVTHGKGLALAIVTIWRQPATDPSPGALSVRTDVDGKYRIVALAPGNYYISAAAPGFVSLPPLTTLAISGETLKDIDFDLNKGGVISGRITDGEGKPLIEQLVTLIATSRTADPVETSATLSLLRARTDDRGIYRLYGLPPGRYKVAAGSQFAAQVSLAGQPAYTRTFYPNVVDEAKAKVIQLNEGMEVLDVDISLGLAARVFAISGCVIDEVTGQPVPNVEYAVDIFSSGSRGSVGRAGATNNRGEFQIDRLPPGRYSLSLPARLTPVGTPPPGFQGESKQFDIIDHDVSGIEIRVVRTASVSGFIRLAGQTDKDAVARLTKLRLTVMSLPKPGNRVTFGSSSINADGSFTVAGLGPGKLNFSIGPGTAGPSTFQFKRVEREGLAPGQNIEINAGDEITDLRLIAVSATGSIRGTVRFADGLMPPNTRLAVRLNGEDARDSAFLPSTFVDPRGQFLLESVPAGKYLLRVSSWGSGVQMRPASQEIVVADGGVSEVTIAIDPNFTHAP